MAQADFQQQVVQILTQLKQQRLDNFLKEVEQEQERSQIEYSHCINIIGELVNKVENISPGSTNHEDYRLAVHLIYVGKTVGNRYAIDLACNVLTQKLKHNGYQDPSQFYLVQKLC